MNGIVEVDSLDLDIGTLRIGDSVTLVSGAVEKVHWLALTELCSLIGIRPHRLKGAIAPRQIARFATSPRLPAQPTVFDSEQTKEIP